MPATTQPLHLRRLVGAADPGDSELLPRYAATGDPEAFAGLVRRHSRSVLGACRRVLADPHAAEDAFQATFLQLARKAATLRTPAALAAWLYRTARRTAFRHRQSAPASTPTDRPAPAPDPLDVLSARELIAAIEDEIDRLPKTYRVPLVLCYLDGLSKTAAAERLGLSPDAFRGRLDRGRDRLRAALARRGFAPAAVLGLLVPAAGPASAELLARTVDICIRGEPIPTAVAALAAGRSGMIGKLGLAAGLVVLAGGLGLLGAAGRADPQAPPPAPPVRTAEPPPRLDLYGDRLPPDALARIGTLRWRHHEEGGNQLHVVPSPTGKLVATAAIGNGAIRVFDVADGRQLCEFPWKDWVGYEVRFTPDGSRVFYLAERGVVRFFDPATGKPTGETRPVVEQDVPHRVRGNPERWNEQYTTHQLTNDGRWILTAHPADGKFTLLLTEVTADAAKPRQVRPDVPDGYRKGVEIYFYACVGDTLIGVGRESAKGQRGPIAFRWDLRSGKLMKTTPLNVRESGFDVSADGSRMVTFTGGVKVWDTDTGTEAVKLEDAGRGDYGTRFSTDGKRVVGVVGDPADETTGLVTVWELDGGKVVGRVKVPRRFDNPFLLPDGQTLLMAGRGLMLSTWDAATGKRLSASAGHEDLIRHLAFSADGRTLFTASRNHDEPMAAWEAATGKKLRDLTAPGGYPRFVLTAGGTIVTAAHDGALVWADATTGREVRRVGLDPLAGDLGGSTLNAELCPGLDPATGRPAVFGLLPARDGGRLVVARWDAASGELLGRRAVSTGSFDRISAISPDGRLVVRETCDPVADGKSGPGGKGVGVEEMLGRQSVVLEDALTGSVRLRLGQPDYLQNRSAAFTPDGQALITWTSTYPPRGPNGTPPGRTTIRLWELRSGKERLAIALPVIGKWWEFEPQAFAVSADGRFLAGARPDKTITVWDLTTGAEVAKRSGHGTVVYCLAFRPDGKALASGHADGTAVVWDLSGIAPARPDRSDREAAWKDLASDDAPKAYRAILALAADPECASFLRDRVKPVAAVTADQVRPLIADLDSAVFASRERATAGLTKLGDAADEPLRAALKGNLSAEQRQRVEDILSKRGLAESDPDRLRALRCVEVLERSGSAEVRDVLGGLAKGAPGARLTRESAAALRR
jgi:RNA polymerase sigma factor (sigma-70 family)